MSKVKMSEVRWGIIGVGDVCEVKSGPAFNLVSDSKLIAVMRRNSDKAADYAKRHNVPKWYDNAEKLINDPDINAVYIATPPDSHMLYTEMSSSARKPVYVEKPMARTYDECVKMVEVCENANVPLFVAYYRRRLPNFLKIEELVHKGAIGEIRHVNIKLYKTLHPDIVGASKSKDNWRVFPEIAGGGYFYDLASHQLDFLDYLFGPVIDAKGFAQNQAGLYPAEDMVSGSFYFKNGVVGQGTWCFTTSKVSSIEETTIIGSRGQIRFSYFGDGSVTLEIEGKEREIIPFVLPRHIQLPLINTIVRDLKGEEKCPSTGVSGARTNWVMEKLSNRVL